MIFHEIYGTYYRTVASVLREAVKGTLTREKLTALIRERAFGESLLTMPEGLQGERWRLLRRDLTTPLGSVPALPLTELEKRWMKAVLSDPRMRLFSPDETGLEDVEPLFDMDSVVWYDRCGDGDDYADPNYIANFRILLRALEEGRCLSLRYRSPQGTRDMTVAPAALEYSEKDDKFRLIAEGRHRRLTLNVGRMEECVLTDREGEFPLHAPETASVTFELEDRRNAMNRVLLHFSHLEKETKRLDERRYRVTLRYDAQDETEMVIRILSFGPAIRVTSPDRFVRLIRERIRRQAAIAGVPVLPNVQQRREDTGSP